MNARPLGAGSTELRLGGIEFWAGSIEPGSNVIELWAGGIEFWAGGIELGSNVIELGLGGSESDSSAKR